MNSYSTCIFSKQLLFHFLIKSSTIDWWDQYMSITVLQERQQELSSWVAKATKLVKTESRVSMACLLASKPSTQSNSFNEWSTILTEHLWGAPYRHIRLWNRGDMTSTCLLHRGHNRGQNLPESAWSETSLRMSPGCPSMLKQTVSLLEGKSTTKWGSPSAA